MRFDQLPPAAVHKTDKPAMREAIRLLRAADIDVRRPRNNAHQLKLDERTSYYPSRGTFYIDGADRAEPESGLAALKAWITKHS